MLTLLRPAAQFGNYISTRLVTGQQLIDALENGVSLVETVQGRFPQVCNEQPAHSPCPLHARPALLLPHSMPCTSCELEPTLHRRVDLSKNIVHDAQIAGIRFAFQHAPNVVTGPRVIRSTLTIRQGPNG